MGQLLDTIITLLAGIFGGRGGIGDSPGAKAQSGGDNPPPNAPPTKNTLTAKRTCYRMPTDDDPASWRDWKGDMTPTSIQVKGLGFRVYPAKFVSAIVGEGAARTGEGVIAYDEHQFTLLDPLKYPWGVGAYGNALVPFRSIAVDPTVIKLRTSCFIPSLAGLTMPNGDLHNGIVTAADTGGRIKGKHIDLFAGKREWEDAITLPDIVDVTFPA